MYINAQKTLTFTFYISKEYHSMLIMGLRGYRLLYILV